MSSNKELTHRRMRTRFCEKVNSCDKDICYLCNERRMWFVRLLDNLSLAKVCNLRIALSSGMSAAITRLVSCVQCWLPSDEQARIQCLVHLNGTSR